MNATISPTLNSDRIARLQRNIAVVEKDIEHLRQMWKDNPYSPRRAFAAMQIRMMEPKLMDLEDALWEMGWEG